ncbi:MFS transporter, partial [Pseudomonas aeruginosa]
MPASASRIQVGSGERRLLLLLSALVAFGPLSIDMYLPSLPAIAADLGASDAQVQRSISGFLVGFCVGMLFYGPLSDRFGRQHRAPAETVGQGTVERHPHEEADQEAADAPLHLGIAGAEIGGHRLQTRPGPGHHARPEDANRRKQRQHA